MPATGWDPAFYDPARADRPTGSTAGAAASSTTLADVRPARFGIMPAAVPDTEPDQLIALQVAAAALADAGGADRLRPPDRVGVILGRGGYLTPGWPGSTSGCAWPTSSSQSLRELLPDLDADALDAGPRPRSSTGSGPPPASAAIGLVPNLAASRIANRLDLAAPRTRSTPPARPR